MAIPLPFAKVERFTPFSIKTFSSTVFQTSSIQVALVLNLLLTKVSISNCVVVFEKHILLPVKLKGHKTLVSLSELSESEARLIGDAIIDAAISISLHEVAIKRPLIIIHAFLVVDKWQPVEPRAEVISRCFGLLDVAEFAPRSVEHGVTLRHDLALTFFYFEGKSFVRRFDLGYHDRTPMDLAWQVCQYYCKYHLQQLLPVFLDQGFFVGLLTVFTCILVFWRPSKWISRWHFLKISAFFNKWN